MTFDAQKLTVEGRLTFGVAFFIETWFGQALARAHFVRYLSDKAQ
jgi:hypothetical protein